MVYFSLAEAARRYDSHRPKVHHVIHDWLTDSNVNAQFQSSLDVACGTGDSTIPITEMSGSTVGVDISDEMLQRAKAKELDVRKVSYLDISNLGKFDFISTCMAFHWFDEKEAISSYKRASKHGAIWLIYNFSFGGSIDSDDFNYWFYEQYLKNYPSPPRGSHFTSISSDDKTIKKINSQEGYITISLTDNELIKYLTTQSNIESAVNEGSSYEEIETGLLTQLSKIDFSDKFKYKYRYEIYEYKDS